MFYDTTDLTNDEIFLQLIKIIETTDIPEDNEMYAEGRRQVMIYRFDL